MTKDFDVVVVGSGIAGCASALFAAGRGMRTLLLEKSGFLGGMTTQSGGTLWIPNNGLHGDFAADPDIEAAEALAYLRFVGAGAQDDVRVATYVQGGHEALREAEAAGVRFQPVPGYADFFYPEAPGGVPSGRIIEAEPFPMDALGEWRARIRSTKYLRIQPPGGSQADLLAWKGKADSSHWDQTVLRARQADGDRWSFGRGLIGALVHRMVERRVDIRLGHGMTDLITGPGGDVTGVRCGSTEFGARQAVILACGSYESNPALVAQLEELPEWRSLAPPHHTGDGLLCATRLGAAVRRIMPNIRLMLGYPTNHEEAEIELLGNNDLGLPHSIVVDGTGRRFGDESFFQDVAAKYQQFDAKAHDFTHRRCILIFDRRHLERFGFRGSRDIGSLPHWVVSAPTLRDLAEAMELDPDSLEQTVAQYNAGVQTGSDPLFGRGTILWSASLGSAGGDTNPNLGAIECGPFYAARLYVGGESTSGILADKTGRVLSWDGDVIPGLFAIGTVAAHTEYGLGYQAGFSLGSSLTFAREAVMEIADH